MGIHSAIKPQETLSIPSVAPGPTLRPVSCEHIVAVVLFAEGQTAVDVSRFFPEGSTVTNAYDGTTAVVTEGMVSFDAGANGTILLAL
jgi:hypothetical protein